MSFGLNKLVQSECGAPNPLVAAAQQITHRPANALTSMSRNVMRPSTSNKGSIQQVNFSREFAQRMEFPQPQQQSSSSSTGMAPTFAVQHQTPANQRLQLNLSNYMSGLTIRQHQPYEMQRNLTAQPSISAAEQLETKYRNDLIAQTTATTTTNHLTDTKADDIEFWQALSQTYLGPTTYNNIARAKAEREANKAAAHTDEPDGMQRQNEVEEALIEQQERQEIFDATDMVENMKLNDTDYIFDDRNPLRDQFEDPFKEGLERLEQGDIPSAALLFEAAVLREPENALAWRFLGTTQAQNEKDNSAIRALRKCLALEPKDQQARLAISVSLANETRHHEACEHLLQWIMNHDTYGNSTGASLTDFQALDSDISEDPFYSNVSLIAQRHYEYVRDKFVQAARMSPNNPDADVQSSLGVIFNMRGEYDKAVDCFKAALSVRSNDSLLWNRLGATLANGNKSDEAVIAYRRALEIAPGFLRSRYNLAISLIHLNLYDEGAKQLVQILNMQAAGKGSRNSQVRTRSITSTSIWNTLRTVATLINKPELYPIIDGRDLPRCNEAILQQSGTAATTSSLN